MTRLFQLASWLLLAASRGHYHVEAFSNTARFQVDAVLPHHHYHRHHSLFSNNFSCSTSVVSPHRQTKTFGPCTRLYSTSSMMLSEDAFEQEESVASSQTLTQATFGLIKAMVGSGILTLPAGLAAATNTPSGLIPANLMLILVGMASGYTFSLYGRLTHATQTKGMGDLWHSIMDGNDRSKNTRNYC